MSDNKAEAERLASISDGGYWNVIEDRFVTTQEEIQKSLEKAQKAGREDHSEDKLDMVNQLAAERAKVGRLLETIESQKQTHDALIKKVENLQNQLEAAKVTKEATEDLQTVHMIGFHSRDDEVRGLKTQNALMREALVKISTTAFQQYDGNKPFISEYDSGYSLGVADGHRLAAKWAYDAIEAARAAGVEVDG